MIDKTSIFASGGEKDTSKTEADFRIGMQPNHVAMAEDVNVYGNMSDTQLWVVCRELVNLLALYGITPDGSSTQADPADPTASQNQLATMFVNNLVQPATLTGIVRSSYTTAPVQTGNSIAFTGFNIAYNTGVYYGNTQAEQRIVPLATQTISANNTWEVGPHFLYAYAASGATQATIMHQQSPIAGSDGADRCFLGSVYVVNEGGNHVFQANTWKFQPWLQITSASVRESPYASTKGGFITDYAGNTLQIGKLEIMAEGINFGVNPNAPSITEVQAPAPFMFKAVYPGYDSSIVEGSAVDTTHIYDHNTGSLETITVQPTPQYIVLVPCVTPTGQGLLITPQQNVGVGAGETYIPIFGSQQDARDAIFGLRYAFNNHEIARCIFLGQSIIVKVGATDLTDPENLLVVGTIPQALAGFTTASGQTGGSAGQYVPMPKYDFTGRTAFTAIDNAANVAGGVTQPITIALPTANQSRISQFEVHYTHADANVNISFTPAADVVWWYNRTPVFQVGNTYNIIAEYINGKWYLGYIEG